MIDKNKLIDLFDRFIDRSERWAVDAEKRTDWNDVYYYQGQKEIVEEIKDMVSKWD